MKASQNQKYNILYGRLSQEDERQGESNSIYNQLPAPFFYHFLHSFLSVNFSVRPADL